jgi:hypothetical protein
MDDLYEVFAGAKNCRSQSEALRNVFDFGFGFFGSSKRTIKNRPL